MTREEKYDLVNSCETIEDLQNAVIKISDEEGFIKGRTREFDAIKMANNVESVVNKGALPNLLTREFGIRQQALYLKHYLRDWEY